MNRSNVLLSIADMITEKEKFEGLAHAYQIQGYLVVWCMHPHKIGYIIQGSEWEEWGLIRQPFQIISEATKEEVERQRKILQDFHQYFELEMELPYAYKIVTE